MSPQPGEKDWSQLAFRAAVHGLCHPFEHAKVLIQVGYEPIAPWPSRTFFGKPCRQLPNIFQYVGYMKKEVGVSGCYRGIHLRVLEFVVGHLAFKATTSRIKIENEKEEEDEEDENLPEDIRRQMFVSTLLREVAGRTVAVIVSHPFHVFAVRSMAQFVGREVKYTGVLSSVREVFHENGICGFFSGLVPRLLAEICHLVIASTLTYAVNTYVLKEKEHRTIVASLMNYAGSNLTYPFLAVSTCMTVTGSGLAAGRPPIMPVYTSWTQCWSHLSANDQLWRGSSTLIWRYDTRRH